jgi:hypothetical protein
MDFRIKKIIVKFIIINTQIYKLKLFWSTSIKWAKYNSSSNGVLGLMLDFVSKVPLLCLVIVKSTGVLETILK